MHTCVTTIYTPENHVKPQNWFVGDLFPLQIASFLRPIWFPRNRGRDHGYCQHVWQSVSKMKEICVYNLQTTGNPSQLKSNWKNEATASFWAANAAAAIHATQTRGMYLQSSTMRRTCLGSRPCIWCSHTFATMHHAYSYTLLILIVHFGLSWNCCLWVAYFYRMLWSPWSFLNLRLDSLHFGWTSFVSRSYLFALGDAGYPW